MAGMTNVLAIVAPLVVIWVLANILGWWRVRGPWNWRILLGPDVYYRWLERKGS